MQNNTPDNVRDRLIEFIEFKNLNKNRFEKICGFSARYVSNINKSISPNRLQVISRHFPELSIEWLTTGEGRMIKENGGVNVSHNSVGNNSQQTILAGPDSSMSIQEKGQYVINEIRKMEQENISLKTENAALKTKVEMLTEQIEWLRTLVKQQN